MIQVVYQCVLLCRYVDSNIGVQFGPNVFADNPRLTEMQVTLQVYVRMYVCTVYLQYCH